MTRKRTESLPSIADAVAAIEALSGRYNVLLSALQSAVNIVDRSDDKPRAALIALEHIRSRIPQNDE